VAIAHDCSHGCVLHHGPVCGQDGTTYMNECLAHCAGTAVHAQGQCPDMRPLRFQQATSVAGELGAVGASQMPNATLPGTPFADSATLLQYAKHGYVYAGRLEAPGQAGSQQRRQHRPGRQAGGHALRMRARREEGNGDLASLQAFAGVVPGSVVRALKFTADGHVYVARCEGMLGLGC
jgi:hypothetical protein